MPLPSFQLHFQHPHRHVHKNNDANKDQFFFWLTIFLFAFFLVNICIQKTVDTKSIDPVII
jgi:hypothetical protein